MPAVFGTVAKRVIPCVGTRGACVARDHVRYRLQATVNAAGTCLPDWLLEPCLWYMFGARGHGIPTTPSVRARGMSNGLARVWELGTEHRSLRLWFLS